MLSFFRLQNAQIDDTGQVAEPVSSDFLLDNGSFAPQIKETPDRENEIDLGFCFACRWPAPYRRFGRFRGEKFNKMDH